MKKHVLRSLSVILLFGLWAAPALYAAAAGPKAVIEKPDHDFGAVDEGTVVEHSFDVLNQGDETLRILSVKPG